MVRILRFLLFPFAILYGIITGFRNVLFNKQRFLKSTSFDLPIIAVGNLSVGGTGKTPQIEYLIRLLQESYTIATLSRGYKRKSKGFILASSDATADQIGDEPYQFHHKFPKVQVAVDADRVSGVLHLQSELPSLDLVLLDDAYQHRRIQAGFYILLSTYQQEYYKDYMLPTGNLREPRKGAKRAQIIIITKCPPNLSEAAQLERIKAINPSPTQQVFFSTIDYMPELKGKESLSLEALQGKEIVLVTGIANPRPLLDYLKAKNIMVDHLDFPDHHSFSGKDIANITAKGKEKYIITTEKDYVRLKAQIGNLYYVEIASKFLKNASIFENSILKYVEDTLKNK